jgi:hypothetical protein
MHRPGNRELDTRIRMKHSMSIRFTASFLVLVFCFTAGLADDKQFNKGAVAPEDNPEKVAKSKANEVVQATIKGEYDKVADFTYPKVVEMMGGREKMISVMKTAFKEMKAKGFETRSVKVGDPSPLVAGNTEVYTIVPFTLEMKVPGGSAIGKSFLLGISADKGKTWTFVDGSGISTEKKKKKLLPHLPEELKLPKPEKPVFHRDE